jgi:hypothetical protein
MNPALLLLLLVRADVPHVSRAVVELPYDLAILSHRQALLLDGRRVRFRVDLESEPGETDDGMIVYDCVSVSNANRTIWLRPGQRVKDVMVVEGVKRVHWREAGTVFQDTTSIAARAPFVGGDGAVHFAPRRCQRRTPR